LIASASRVTLGDPLALELAGGVTADADVFA
jgi:hypothetical protein